jgi:hypothetical protein
LTPSEREADMTHIIVNPWHIKDRSGFRTEEEISEIFFMLKPCKKFTYAHMAIDGKLPAIAVICKETFKKLGYIV